MKKLDIIVGLSGGVDSSVTALLLKKQGHRVRAVFMQNWETDNDDPYCTSEQDLRDAQAICDQLQIPLAVCNFAKEYWQRVFQHCLDEFKRGHTPNPDILCNSEIKFKAFLDYALSQQADYIATGHYAKIIEDTGHYYLHKAHDQDKDQSYFLYALKEAQLTKALFPLGELSKQQVRSIALENNLITHNKKDSTGICFIGERNFKDFLEEFFLHQPGEIVTINNDIIGQHDGLMFYTIGQRKGINIGGLKSYPNATWYVVDKNIAQNKLVVANCADHPALFKNKLYCEQISWINEAPHLPLNCRAKIRYRQTDQGCHVQMTNNNKLEVVFDEAQRAVTPGQSIVFYQGDRCLGGAIITIPRAATI